MDPHWLRETPSHLPLFLETSDFFNASLVLPFPNCHVVEAIQQVAFSDWLLSLSNIQVSFLHIFSWLGGSFLFRAE